MEKRKYDKRNKKSFVLIIILSIAIIGIFSLFIYRYLKSSKIKYDIVAGSIIQDVLKNYVNVEDNAILKMRWNGNYYLEYNGEKISLGQQLINYNTIDGSLKLYGIFYEVNEEGKVIQHKDETVLNNTTEAKFYKLGDREYLLVDSKIFSEDRKIEANNYLLVELDKSGNAKLSNNNLNLKTIAPTKLVTSKYTFDINNEILSFGKDDINLKKIIGSTNEYVPDEKKDNEETTNNGGNGTGIGTGEGNGAGNVINNTDTGNTTSIGEIVEKLKMSSVIKYLVGLNQIDFDYVIFDPYNEYKSIYVEIIGDGKIDTLYLNKNDTHVTINNLSINTVYKINFIYTTSNGETGELMANTFDSYELRTLLPEYNISISRISKVDNRITYKVDLDERVIADKINVQLEFDYREIDELTGDINIKTAKLEDILSVGSSKYVFGTFDISDYSIDNNTLIKVSIKSVLVGGRTLTINESSVTPFGR